MAKKGQKFHKFSDAERESIVNCYLSGNGSLLDVGNKFGISRKTVYSMIRKYRNTGSVKSTKKTGRPKEKDVHGLIIYSDQGFQYTSHEYKVVCESNGIQISMSRKGTPIDDSPIESWHSLLKKETLYNNNITSLQEYIQLVEEWILFYNTTRLKSKVKKKRKTYTKREK